MHSTLPRKKKERAVLAPNHLCPTDTLNPYRYPSTRHSGDKSRHSHPLQLRSLARFALLWAAPAERAHSGAVLTPQLAGVGVGVGARGHTLAHSVLTFHRTWDCKPWQCFQDWDERAAVW